MNFFFFIIRFINAWELLELRINKLHFHSTNINYKLVFLNKSNISASINSIRSNVHVQSFQFIFHITFLLYPPVLTLMFDVIKVMGKIISRYIIQCLNEKGKLLTSKKFSNNFSLAIYNFQEQII